MAIESNMIFSGETIRIVSTLTDINDQAVSFSDLIAATVIVSDNLGNQVSPPVEVDPNNSNALTYLIDTTTLRQGPIVGKITLTFNSLNFPSTTTDIIKQELFEIEGKKSDGEGLIKNRPIKIGDEIGSGAYPYTYPFTYS